MKKLVNLGLDKFVLLNTINSASSTQTWSSNGGGSKLVCELFSNTAGQRLSITVIECLLSSSSEHSWGALLSRNGLYREADERVTGNVRMSADTDLRNRSCNIGRHFVSVTSRWRLVGNLLANCDSFRSIDSAFANEIGGYSGVRGDKS
ncbi:hypothetical protein KM043_004521 [Ampulex compressa]|nr:hypothetical protein KM043_004521 [Ampulex compressa]